MARLLIQTKEIDLRAMELRMGANRVGRDPGNDFTILHPTVSTSHCEFILSSEGVVLHDLDSTNGSFINDQPVTHAWLEEGQTVRLGNVEILVESTGVTIAIPRMESPAPVVKPTVKLENGILACPRHEDLMATFRCTTCGEVMCSGCVRMMRRQGGLPLFLCTLCHNKCERIELNPVKAKRGFLGFIQNTVRLKFGGHPKP